MQVDLVKTYRFEAAHSTPFRDDQARLHGHSFQVDLIVSGECDEELGWLIDYAEITENFNALYDALDHRLLNEVSGLATPLLGDVEAWILARLQPQLPQLQAVHISVLGDSVFSPKTMPAQDAPKLPERIRFGFEAAHSLPKLPADHKCYRMHGHSFVVEVGAVDLERLTPLLEEVYDQLDHRCLNDILGLENPTSEQVSRWIWDKLANRIDDLRVVTVAETCTARCNYHGG